MTRNRPNLSFLSGLYTRVARQMGVHPSYVSRIARGERRSEQISRAIAAELAQLAAHAGESSPEDACLTIDPETWRMLSERTARRFKTNPRLRKLNATVINVTSWAQPEHVTRVSRASLQRRIAENSPMIAAAIEHFQRLSARLEKFPHVLSLIDREAVVLYSYGTTGMIRQEGRIPGSDWSGERNGISAAARAVSSGAPIVLLGAKPDDDGLLSARLACPVRLSNRQIAGVVLLSLDSEYLRPEHLVDLCKVARKVCKPLDVPSSRYGRNSTRSLVQPFEEAELYLARVMSLPQIDPATRAGLAELLADLESSRREIMLRGETAKSKRAGKAQARGVS